jgi:hypothetical protein
MFSVFSGRARRLLLQPFFERFEALDNESGNVSDAFDSWLLAGDAIGRRPDRPGEALHPVEFIGEAERFVLGADYCEPRCLSGHAVLLFLSRGRLRALGPDV